jgi:hypothetical protein
MVPTRILPINRKPQAIATMKSRKESAEHHVTFSEAMSNVYGLTGIIRSRLNAV